MSPSQKPADQTPRERTNFDGGWAFFPGDAGGAEAPDFDDADWREVDLPHDWSIEGTVSEANPSGAKGGYFPCGVGWYRKRFDAPAAWDGKKLFVEFDGVFCNSDVWINGHHLGHRPNGYVSFQHDLTEHLNVDGANVLAVRVDNSRQPNSRWYTGSGIYRHVRLTVTHPVYAAHWGVCITTPEVSPEAATVAVRTTIRNETSSAKVIELRSTVLDPTGQPVGAATERREIPPNGEHTYEQTIEVPRPALWSPEMPSLYALRSEVTDGGTTVDAQDTCFGIRVVLFDAARGMLLNGWPVKMKGVCEHHDAGCVGAAVPDAVLARRLRILKRMGCNAIRTAHNPPSPALLDLCDRMGMLVIDEGFDEWKVAKTPHGYSTVFEKWWHRDLTDWILRDRNHPCVVLWSIGNEIREQCDSAGVETGRKIVDAIHRLEPTRPVTCGLNWHADADTWIAEVLDVVGINGGGGGCFQYENYHRDNPTWKLYASEVPHTLQTRGVYQTVTHYRNEDLGGGILKTPSLAEPEALGQIHPRYRSAYDNAYVRINCRDSWAQTSKHDFFAGEFRWSGFDYLGESLGWPCKNWNFGIIDLCGFPKDSYYFYQSRWTPRPMVHILPHWTWPGKEGTAIPVVAYSNCEQVELFLNGTSLGRKATADRMDLTWHVPYAPGILKAVGSVDGQAVAATERVTAGDPAGIALSVDRETIDADGADAVHVQVEIVDAGGHVAPHADDRVHFTVTGPGRLIGVDNGDPIDHDNYKLDHRKAFSGMCLAIVQSTGQPGTIRLAAAAEGLASAEIAVAAGR